MNVNSEIYFYSVFLYGVELWTAENIRRNGNVAFIEEIRWKEVFTSEAVLKLVD